MAPGLTGQRPSNGRLSAFPPSRPRSLRIENLQLACLRAAKTAGVVRLSSLFFTFLILCLGGCRRAASQPVTVTILDPEWSQPDELPRAELESQEFTRETGIPLKHLPVPETSLGQLDLLRGLLQEGGSSPDVVGIDVIWPGILDEYLVDLRPYLANEIAAQDPQLIAGYTVDRKVVAMPYHTHVGVLEYRTDLLRKYGYNHPPKTWDELEQMAARIQAGERAKGKKDFWGLRLPRSCWGRLDVQRLGMADRRGGRANHRERQDHQREQSSRHPSMATSCALGRLDIAAQCCGLPGARFHERLGLRRVRFPAHLAVGLSSGPLARIRDAGQDWLFKYAWRSGRASRYARGYRFGGFPLLDSSSRSDNAHSFFDRQRASIEGWRSRWATAPTRAVRVAADSRPVPAISSNDAAKGWRG